MNDNLLLGLLRHTVPIPSALWKRQVAQNARNADAELGFMTADHHRVRNFVVRELARRGEPLSPGLIAQELNLPLAQTNVILDELEKRMTFLFRNEQGAVTWAYPVTVDKTPHHVRLSNGERVYAA